MKPPAVEIAQKQRHLHLLTRIRNNRPLSRAELAELNEFENQMSGKKTTGPQEKNNGRATKKDNKAEVAAEIVETQEAAALYVGRNARTIRRWEKEGMFTAVKNGRKVYVKSQLKLFAENEGKKPTKARSRRDEGEASLKETRAELAKLELHEKQGRFILKEESERVNIQKILAVKRALLGQGRKLALQLAAMIDPRKIQELIDRENRQIIEGFRR